MNALIALFGLLSALAADPQPAGDLRMIETSPDVVKLLTQTYPDRVRMVSASVVLLPSDLLGELSQKLHELTGHCGGFMDVTGEKPRRPTIQSITDLPQLDGKRDWIAGMLGDVRPDNIRDFDGRYSGAFKTRYASSSDGELAPHWLRDTWAKMAADAGRPDIQVELVTPPRGYAQNSVRITILGSDEQAPLVIMGAHLDSINRGGDGTAPGADDDGSGIAALTEAYRVMLEHRVKPKHTIQIFGYAAEELGLLGSRVIAEHYQSKGVKVRAVLQLDMVAYPGENRAITFMMDYVDQSLTLWTQQLYGLYVGGEIKEDRCGYGCSDHASWTRYGYPSVMPFETEMHAMNPRIHSSRDVWDEQLDVEFAGRFTKLALAFVGELSI